MILKHQFFKILGLLEKKVTSWQGKGCGSISIDLEVKTLQQLLSRKPKIFIDIGGNVGLYTAKMKALNPDLEVHIFEPSPVNIIKLQERFQKDPLISILPFALSDEKKEGTLFSDKAGSGLASLTKRKLDHFHIAFDHEEKVKCLRFEDYWHENLSSKPIDCVKMDVEGHELDVLKGFGKALDATQLIQFEFGGCNIDTRTYFQDFWYFFSDHHFTLYRVTPLGAQHIPHYKEIDEFFSTTNYIAVRKND